MKVSKESPLAEITLRKYESPNLQGRDLVRKLCLSLGLLQPADSRDVIVDIFYVLLKNRKAMNLEEIKKNVINIRKENNLSLNGLADSNIRRQLRRLRALHFVEKKENYYRINEGEKLSKIFEEKIENFLLPSIINRVKEYIKKVDKEFEND